MNNMLYDEAIKKLNEFRNRHYNDQDQELRGIAQALNVVLPQTIKNSERAKKVEELLKLYQYKEILSGRYNNASHGYSNENENDIASIIRSVREQITKLEKELEELK